MEDHQHRPASQPDVLRNPRRLRLHGTEAIARRRRRCHDDPSGTTKKASTRSFGVRSLREAADILDTPVPSPNPATNFVVRVVYAGINPIDYRRVAWLTEDTKLPHVLGVDFAGTLDGVPAGEHAHHVRDRVFDMSRRTGRYSEVVLTSQTAAGEAFAQIPDGLTFRQAATLPVAGLTALGGLELFGIREGQAPLVFGAAGGYAQDGRSSPAGAEYAGALRNSQASCSGIRVDLDRGRVNLRFRLPADLKEPA